MSAFEGDKNLINDYIQIVDKFKPNLLIETGTHLGNTTEFLATFDIPVLAIEKQLSFFNKTYEKIKIYKHVQLILGDSAEIMQEKYEYLKDKKILAFLDAHWCHDKVLERELTFIATLPIKPFLILHDFFNPFHPEYNYDSHDGKVYTFDEYKTYIENIYGKKYKVCYNSENVNKIDPKNIQGTLFIKPLNI